MSVGIVITPLNEEALDLLCGEGAVKAVKRWGGHVDQAVMRIRGVASGVPYKGETPRNS